MKNIFKTFIFGVLVILASAAIITFGLGAFKGFASIASAAGWAVVFYFVIGIVFTGAALIGAFTLGSALLSFKKYGGK